MAEHEDNRPGIPIAPDSPDVIQIETPPRLKGDIPAGGDAELIPFEIPLNGRLITAEDGAVIGKNFMVLKNMRYTDTHPKGIGGMTAINSTVPTT